jgi:naringenin degradation protein FdeH
VRRIVTGHDEGGNPTILFEGEPPTVMDFGGIVTTELWVTDATPPDLERPDDTSLREWEIDPPPGGAAFRSVTIMPQSERTDGGDEDPEFLGAHRTDTLDFVVVVSGEITMTIGDREVTLRQGDSVVQRATAHNWENRGSVPCVLAGVLISAR